MRYSLQLIKPTKSILKLLPTATNYTVIFDANNDGYYYYRVIVPESILGDNSILNEIFPFQTASFDNNYTVEEYCEQANIDTPFKGYVVNDYNRNGETIVTSSYLLNDSYSYSNDGTLPMGYLPNDEHCYCIPLKISGASFYFDIDFDFIYLNCSTILDSVSMGKTFHSIDFPYITSIPCLDLESIIQPAGIYTKVNNQVPDISQILVLLKPLK